MYHEKVLNLKKLGLGYILYSLVTNFTYDIGAAEHRSWPEDWRGATNWLSDQNAAAESGRNTGLQKGTRHT